MEILVVLQFPSPFGVLSFLIWQRYVGGRWDNKFPSPFGVLSFLMIDELIKNIDKVQSVSVSFRSSLISYTKKIELLENKLKEGFRLLSEFSHFLLNDLFEEMPPMQFVSVSFRSSLISYLK